jgi:hypothetical protein
MQKKAKQGKDSAMQAEFEVQAKRKGGRRKFSWRRDEPKKGEKMPKKAWKCQKKSACSIYKTIQLTGLDAKVAAVQAYKMRENAKEGEKMEVRATWHRRRKKDRRRNLPIIQLI